MSAGLRLILCCLLPLAGIGQSPEGFDAAANLSASASHMFRSFDNRYEGVHGFPTIFEKFVKGKVKVKDGNVTSQELLNFDAFTSELLVKSSVKPDMVMVLRSESIEWFTLVSDEGHAMEFVKLQGKGNQFFQRIYEGKVALYKKPQKNLEKANYGGAYNTTNSKKFDEFVPADKYFAVSGELREIKPNKRDIEKLFPDKGEKLRDYLKSYKPDLKNDAELAALFKFMNED